jgi:hypothetical protein
VARIVATFENCVKRAQNTSGSEQPVVEKSPLIVLDELECTPRDVSMCCDSSVGLSGDRDVSMCCDDRADSIHHQREDRFSLKPEDERLPKKPEGC